MSSSENRIQLVICGQSFRLRCPEGEEARLRAAAEMVEEKINEMKQSGLVDSLRCAVMAAFHLAYESISRDEKNFHHSSEYKKLQKRLRTLVEEIDSNF